MSEPRYRITGGHPIFEFWVEDTWCGCDIMAYFSTYEAAENWVRTEGLPGYPTGDVVGPCVCGSWPGGVCYRCPVSPAKEGSPP